MFGSNRPDFSNLTFYLAGAHYRCDRHLRGPHVPDQVEGERRGRPGRRQAGQQQVPTGEKAELRKVPSKGSVDQLHFDIILLVNN